MKLEKELGSYSRWIQHEYLSFQTNGASAPTVIRDGKTGLVKSVTRVSAGLYTVALRTDRPTMKYQISPVVSLTQINVPPTQGSDAYFVEGSWNQSAGTFQVQVTNGTGTTNVDPDTGCRVAVRLVGSIRSVGTDPA